MLQRKSKLYENKLCYLKHRLSCVYFFHIHSCIYYLASLGSLAEDNYDVYFLHPFKIGTYLKSGILTSQESSRISFQTQLLTPEVITLGLNFGTHGLPEPQCPNRICCPIDLSPVVAGKFCAFTETWLVCLISMLQLTQATALSNSFVSVTATSLLISKAQEGDEKWQLCISYGNTLYLEKAIKFDTF